MIQWTQATLNTIILAINSRAKIASPTFTGTVSGITKDMVGLNNVTNESKATMFTDPAFTGVAVLPSTTSIGTVSSTEIGYLDGVTSAIQTQLGTKAPLASPTFTGTVEGITSSMIGLGLVNNTSDADKPVSTATQTALNLKANLSSPALTGTPTAPTPTAGDNSTKIATTAFVKAKSELDSIGVNQTWQDVTASRAFGTTYTNSTGKPIIATIFTSNGAASGVVRMFVDGKQVFRASTYTGEGASGISVIPNGSTYYATGTVALTSWYELR